MQFKKYTKQRHNSIQGLRSLKDTLPKNIKKVINKRGQIYSETLNNWKFIVGKDLFKVCYPKSFKNANKFGVGTLLIMVKRGHEIDLEYSKNQIIEKMNTFFGSLVIERIKLTSFHEKITETEKKSELRSNVTNKKYLKKINNVNNEKIKKSLMKLSEVFREK